MGSCVSSAHFLFISDPADPRPNAARLSTLRRDYWVYQRRSGLSHSNRPAALHHATETDWVVTSSGGSKESIDVRFVAPQSPFVPEERGPSDARTAHVFSVGKRRLMAQRARRIG